VEEWGGEKEMRTGSLKLPLRAVGRPTFGGENMVRAARRRALVVRMSTSLDIPAVDGPQFEPTRHVGPGVARQATDSGAENQRSTLAASPGQQSRFYERNLDFANPNKRNIFRK